MSRCLSGPNLLLASLLFVPLLTAGCASESAGETPARLTPQRPASVRFVRPVVVVAEDGYPSSLYVERDVIVTARSSGIIEKVLVDRGSRVKMGDPLAVLETDLASRELEKKEQALKLAQAEFEQSQSLHEQKIASNHDFLLATITRDQAVTDVELARAILERCHVRAPFDGVVVERRTVVGQRVVEDDSTPLFRVVAVDPLRARVDVPEGRLAGLKPGGKAVVDSALNGGPSQEARIVFLSPAVDAASGTAPVIVELASRNGPLRLGASVRVRFENSSPEAASPQVRLPREAFPAQSMERDTEVTLLVIEKGRAAPRRVKILESRGGSVVVNGPLTASDQVIVEAGGIREGEAVLAGEEMR